MREDTTHHHLLGGNIASECSTFKLAHPYTHSVHSSDGNDSPPKKKQGFFSWLRKDLTENVIKSEPTAEEVEAAKRAQEARGDANLFDSVGRAIETQQRDEISKTVGADIPGDISSEEARRLMKKALKPKATEVCPLFLLFMFICSGIIHSLYAAPILDCQL